MHDKGMSVSQIAREVGRDRKTIRKWLGESEPAMYKRHTYKPKKIDPYREYVLRRMSEGCVNATVIFDEISEMGYDGGITQLRVFMKPHRQAAEEKATTRFETLPGEQAQVDWGSFTVNWHGHKKRIYAFVMVLGYSRMMYLEFTENEKLETLMGCHVRAAAYFNGVTATCLYDNMKTVVASQDDRGKPIWNERFAAFATHHGFKLRRCKPYRARTKGKVENGVKYVRRNFWPRVRTFTGLDDLNRQARHWLDTVANVRVHGTTHQRPIDRYPEEQLLPMNTVPFESAERHLRKVPSDALVTYETNRYSVPYQLVGYMVEIQDERNGVILFFHAGKLVAEHTKCPGRHVINKKHFEGILTGGKQKVPQPIPRLIENPAPEVMRRPLSVYDRLLKEEVVR
ncbi:IS21 family transposase [Alicyclobacillus dauci]|uniref:IS21 family transposase n=1 Tax=Alicyclobacillus dauci TaxID=1475485 RepID=A0ABY6Z260_9BACL|nr:IS21 family transposase [Alicyclobacillus dauci]WAH36835.1 IS21 family transposase [Alicyclobacillus dauci]